MRWREALHPVGMQRVALVAPRAALRDALVVVGDAGTVELDPRPGTQPTLPGSASARLQRLPTRPTTAALSSLPPDLDDCEAHGRFDLIAGEAELEERAARAVTEGRVAALVGWTPVEAMAPLTDRLAALGAAAVPLPAPRGVQPPTLLTQHGTSHELAPLVRTYATVPYADLDPSVLAGVAYVVMFGMMFADAGHGALLLAAGLAARAQAWRLARLRPVWTFLVGAGAASVFFGVLYGEFFGPTGVLPVLWMAPLEHPVPLLGVAVVAGGVLLAGAYALGSVNRFREGGWRRAVYAPSGLAGTAVFLGLGLLAAGIYLDVAWVVVLAGVVAAAGLVAAYAGLFTAAGGGVGGGAQAAVELVDLVVRLGSNVVSFARLAAFGLTHAALGAVIWQATSGLWGRGPAAGLAAVLVFVVGNALAFTLEGVVAAIQALRLEYYELFSRVFDLEGRPFQPWHVPLAPQEVVP
ncbi:V-type ATPase 116kDa subunit family protein [Nocardioides sp. MAHUQ-72]|uniref:V-type ATPase 116kDa subunit family protein n=1 Tax=unclassified Nocardioides TaxID=2615069 RepID=UPI0036182FCE